MKLNHTSFVNIVGQKVTQIGDIHLEELGGEPTSWVRLGDELKESTPRTRRATLQIVSGLLESSSDQLSGLELASSLWSIMQRPGAKGTLGPTVGGGVCVCNGQWCQQIMWPFSGRAIELSWT